MVTTINNVLIVEDEDDWCAIYERTARREGVDTIKVAKTLSEAERLIDAMEFAVAFVDVGLDVGDDRNIDGLRVMEKIRAVGDETSIIVVTGRSGRDVLPITRDAIIKYHAYDTVGKVPLEPSDLRRLLLGGLQTYKKTASSARPHVHQVLRGDIPAWKWDDHMMRFTHIKGDIKALYNFLDRLFQRFLPVIPCVAEEAVRLHDASRIAYGTFWSRAVGDAIAVCFGAAEDVKQAIEVAQSSGALAENARVGAVLHTASAGSVFGAVFALDNAQRESFP
ncbi:MAG TPA: response regulator [Pseudonocardiaceae bacterium]|nr:response regulator [Pseudonocardiaceae bacterium]